MEKGECNYYGKSHDGECKKKLGVFFGCRYGDHLLKDYPSKLDFSTKSPQKFQNKSKSEMETKSNSVQGSQRKNYSKTSFRASTRTYVMKVKEDANLPEVITGNFSFIGNNFDALIDPWSTHYYICNKVIESLSLEVEYSNTNVLVTNPLGQSTLVKKLIKNCPLFVNEHMFLADLLLLSFYEFDVILGLDWLARHNVMVECRFRSVRLASTKGEEILLSELANRIISAMFARKLIVQGTDTYLAYIMDTPESRSEISQVLVVKEFSDVFSKELPSLPPEER
ncbi:heat shock protein 90-6, mitochondrial-like [Gossypium australe]|uniref:Heat shock protein 90-6, mitochondrial-like n=1 Tax=Gossypium australe TaxID=47621 RepID=A0A5B6UQX5_9ROSI|nr:heat shock protein 90-6, mitochondrial-like [Gossypium australe]